MEGLDIGLKAVGAGLAMIGAMGPGIGIGMIGEVDIVKREVGNPGHRTKSVVVSINY